MRLLPLAATCMLAVVVAPPLAAQEGQTYLITVTREDGQTFRACVTFSDEAPGAWTLFAPGFDPFIGVWAHTNLNRNKKFWQALVIFDTDVIGFHGKATGRGKKIKGDFIESGDESLGTLTGTLKGKKDPDCESKLR